MPTKVTVDVINVSKIFLKRLKRVFIAVILKSCDDFFSDLIAMVTSVCLSVCLPSPFVSSDVGGLWW